MNRRTGSRSIAVRCGLTAALALASVAAWAGHTDDGCAVELHCFACYWSMAATVEFTVPVAVDPMVTPVGPGNSAERAPVVETSAPAVTSRGPPAV